jgi:hypothetical protein
MKVYYQASDWRGYCWFKDYLEGHYPIKDDRLYVTGTPPDTTHMWDSMESHELYREITYEIELPHSEAELMPYRSDRPWGQDGWDLPWYVVANHPVRIMDASISRRIMGQPEPEN